MGVVTTGVLGDGGWNRLSLHRQVSPQRSISSVSDYNSVSVIQCRCVHPDAWRHCLDSRLFDDDDFFSMSAKGKKNLKPVEKGKERGGFDFPNKSNSRKMRQVTKFNKGEPLQPCYAKSSDRPKMQLGNHTSTRPVSVRFPHRPHWICPRARLNRALLSFAQSQAEKELGRQWRRLFQFRDGFLDVG